MFFEVRTFAGTIEFSGNESDIEANPGNGPADQAILFLPFGIAVTPSGVVHVTEPFFNGLRKIENGVVSTVTSRRRGAEDGPLSQSSFGGPTGVVSDAAGNLYIADQSNHRIRKIDPSGTVTTVAGPSGSERASGWVDDIGTEARFSRPRAIALNAADKSLYVSEHDRIRNIPLALVPGRGTMEVRTVAAVGLKGFADGPPLLAQFDLPLGLAVAQNGDIFVADANNRRIRRVTPRGQVTTVAGDGTPPQPTDATEFAKGVPALQARFQRPSGIAVDPTGMVWISDDKHLRIYDPGANTVSTACSDREGKHPIAFGRAAGIALSGENIFVVDSGRVLQLTRKDG
jgi:DNA-binding beta-propeller fold protein YncE